GREVRYALMRVNYRVPLNFTWDGMEEARESLKRIDDWLRRLHECGASLQLANSTNRQVENLPHEQFEEALDDDLNISAALGLLFESIRDTNRALDRNELDRGSASAWLAWWDRINSVLVLDQEETAAIPADIAALAEARETARLAKEWQKSDELRKELSAL